jgi:hypothetical protein
VPLLLHLNFLFITIFIVAAYETQLVATYIRPRDDLMRASELKCVMHTRGTLRMYARGRKKKGKAGCAEFSLDVIALACVHLLARDIKASEIFPEAILTYFKDSKFKLCR